MINEVEDKFKIRINGSQYVNTVALVASLHKNMSRFNNTAHRAYKGFSWHFLTALRDSPQIKAVHQFIYDEIQKKSSQLKHKRIIILAKTN